MLKNQMPELLSVPKALTRKGWMYFLLPNILVSLIYFEGGKWWNRLPCRGLSGMPVASKFSKGPEAL